MSATEEGGMPELALSLSIEFEKGGWKCRSDVGGACCWSRGDVPPVWHELEGVIDSDLAKEGLKCTSKPLHLPFHVVQLLGGPSQFLSDLVEGVDPCFEDSDLLLLLHVLVLEIWKKI